MIKILSNDIIGQGVEASIVAASIGGNKTDFVARIDNSTPVDRKYQEQLFASLIKERDDLNSQGIDNPLNNISIPVAFEENENGTYWITRRETGDVSKLIPVMSSEEINELIRIQLTVIDYFIAKGIFYSDFKLENTLYTRNDDGSLHFRICDIHNCRRFQDIKSLDSKEHMFLACLIGLSSEASFILTYNKKLSSSLKAKLKVLAELNLFDNGVDMYKEFNTLSELYQSV